ncbi:MAG: hypothetical protein HOP11_01120 [Saprospiraceae bacterium]|nr:hypothetical protein [Saprospiraceae bacterium]
MSRILLLMLTIISIGCKAQESEKYNLGFEDLSDNASLSNGWYKFGTYEFGLKANIILNEGVSLWGLLGSPKCEGLGLGMALKQFFSKYCRTIVIQIIKDSYQILNNYTIYTFSGLRFLAR